MYGREQKFFYKVLFSEESTLIAENFNDHLGGKSRILGSSFLNTIMMISNNSLHIYLYNIKRI